MSELMAYATLGFQHITDPRGADHIVFLLALAAVYRSRDWRECAWVVTAFTVGHSVTLALAVTGTSPLSPSTVELLIPLTILATAVENLIVRDRRGAMWGRSSRPLFAGVFGLVHGAGFANYLRSLFVDRVAVPLLGFNLGLEVGQLLVIAFAFATFTALDRAIRAGAAFTRANSVERAVRLRTFAVSVLVMAVATRWTLDRLPW